MGKYDTLIIAGAALGALVLFREQIKGFFGGISQVGQGLGQGIGGLGSGINTAATGLGSGIGTIGQEIGETVKGVTDVAQGITGLASATLEKAKNTTFTAPESSGSWAADLTKFNIYNPATWGPSLAALDPNSIYGQIKGLDSARGPSVAQVTDQVNAMLQGGYTADLRPSNITVTPAAAATAASGSGLIKSSSGSFRISYPFGLVRKAEESISTKPGELGRTASGRLIKKSTRYLRG